jgi:two-component system chemotaxis sensor kinase CheA
VNSRVDLDLRSQFDIEVSQHLAVIEPLLLTADFAALARPEIDLLFRGFHSIKGLARVLNAKGMEAVAHEAESLLSQVRRGERGFDASCQEPMIAVTDWLKDALGEPLSSQAPASIIEALQRASNGLEQDGSTSATAPITSGEPWRYIGDDADLLRAFAELLRELLPDAAHAMLNDVDHEWEALAGTIAHACSRLGLDRMEVIARRLAAERGIERLRTLGDLLRQAARFGHLIGDECGAASTIEILRPSFTSILVQSLDEALAAGPQQRRSLAARCVGLSELLLPHVGVAELIADLIATLPATVTSDRDVDPLVCEALFTLKRAIDHAAESEAALSALRDTVRAPYLASEEIAAHLRKLGFDTRLFTPGPPQRFVRLSMLLEGSGTTIKEAIIELPGLDGLIRLAHQEPLLAQLTRSGERPVLAILLIGNEEPDAVADRLRAVAGDSVREFRRVDPGQGSGAFSPPRPVTSGFQVASETQVRVPIEVLDKLFGRIGEFFSLSSRLNALATEADVPDALRRLQNFAVTRAPELREDVDILLRQHRDFSSVEVDVGRLISLIHESTLGLRVIPLDTLAARYPRMVRETARSQGKQVRFIFETGGIRIDKGMSDMLADPLTHMLRNAIDHGIETETERLAKGKPRSATLRLTALQQANRILVEISDDGRGIDIARVKRRAIESRLASEHEILGMSDEQVTRFIFTPGFSTATEISDVSGRGVGMDVALVNVTKLGGKIDIATVAGQGTTFRLDLPLSAAIQPMLLADTGVQPIGFPEAMVSEALVFPAAALQHVNGQRSILLRNRFLPLFKLTELLRLPEPPAQRRADLPIVLCEWSGQRMGIEVHRILRRGEMLIRETHPRVAALPGIGGISTMGFDRIVLVLDPDEIFDLARKSSMFGLRVPDERLRLEQALEGAG